MGSLTLLKALPYIVAILLIGGGLWYFGHSRYESGYAAAQALQAKAVIKQNTKVEKQVTDATNITEKHDDAIANKQEDTEHKFDNAAVNIQPVRLCKSAPASGQMRTLPATSSPTIDSSNPERLLSGTERDIGPALLMLVQHAQQDNDYAIEYNAWYTEQLKAQLQNK